MDEFTQRGKIVEAKPPGNHTKKKICILHADPQQRVVNMDESYIHRHYKRMKDTIYAPNDENELSKGKHKGGRFCFIAAIIDEDDSIPVDKHTYDHQAHMMVSTLDYFRRGKQTKDYHGMFDGAYYLRWFQDLLYCLEEMGVKNAVIAMDNEKYHKCLPPGAPKASWTKD
jgi:hypothetical protein